MTEPQEVERLAERMVAAGPPLNILTEAGWRIVIGALRERFPDLAYALVRTPETLDVDALVASLPAVRRRTDVQPMIPESAVRRLLTTLAAAQSPTPPEGLRFAEISDPIAGSRVVFDAASPAPDPGAGLPSLDEFAATVIRVLNDNGWSVYDTRGGNMAWVDRRRLASVLRAAIAPSAEPPETAR